MLEDLGVDEIVGEIVQSGEKQELSTDDRLSLISFLQKTHAEPYMFYTPNGACEDYIKACGMAPQSKKRVFLFSAANGVGKSCTGVNIMANIFFQANTKWFDYPLYNSRWPLPKIFWMITEDSTLREKIEPEIKKWFPPGKYKTSQEGKTHLSRLDTETGFTVFFKTNDQDPSKFESADLGGIFYDEPPPEEIHKACTSRLREGGFIFAQLTPLHRAAWILDRWILNQKIQPYFYSRFADVWENSKSKGVRGRLTDENIEFMLSQYDPEEIEARAYGKFTHLRGLVYKEYSDETPYVIPPPKNINSKYEYQTVCVIDPHDRRLPAIGWYAVDRANQKYVVHEWPNLEKFNNRYYDEIPNKSYTFKDIVEVIKNEEKERKLNVTWRLIDPNRGRTPYANTGLTVREEFERHGLYFDSYVNDDLLIGHQTVRELLALNNYGKPELQILEHCYNHRWAFMRYMYDDHQGKTKDKKAAKEDVLDKGKDFMDCLRYYAVRNFKFKQRYSVDPKSWRSRVKKKRSVSSGYMGA